MKLASVARLSLIAALAAAGSAHADLNEGFDTVVPAGWSAINNSVGAANNWFQGNSTVFAAQSGVATSYAGANYQFSSGTTGTETISGWLITPLLTGIQNGDTISFYTRTVDTPSFPDRLELRLSTNGGANPGVGATSVGDFSTLLLTVNSGLTTTGYPNTWTQFSAVISGLGGPVNGAIAFRYYVTNAGPVGANSDYIGVDTFSYQQVPEPAAGLFALVGLAAFRRRR